jgi:hypothetical protein
MLYQDPGDIVFGALFLAVVMVGGYILRTKRAMSLERSHNYAGSY